LTFCHVLKFFITLHEFGESAEAFQDISKVLLDNFATDLAHESEFSIVLGIDEFETDSCFFNIF